MSKGNYIDQTKPVLIAGAGPAGLMLGLFLARHEVPFYLFEKKSKHHLHSRAIGIHPPSLKILAQLDLLDLFRSRGHIVIRGEAFVGSEKMGYLDFSDVPFDHPYILTIPQHETERLLRDKLLALRPNSIKYGHEVTDWNSVDSGGLHVKYRKSDPSSPKTTERLSMQTSLLVGCDGRNSSVRQGINPDLIVKKHFDTYIMGDFQMEEKNSRSASVYLHPEGVIESFPLPERRRRWVVKTSTYESNPSPSRIINEVRRRLDFKPEMKQCLRTSGFRVEQILSRPLCKDRCILAGDAAHVVSPIGGQGMNLGWLGACTLADQIISMYEQTVPTSALKTYDSTQRKRARKAKRRALFNMWMGRSHHYSWPRRLLIKLMVQTPLHQLAARAFTMYGLDR